jgi:transglutaminase-like putative cysteine protease
MFFQIDHITRYAYSAPVHLGEHLLRFLPAKRAGQRPRRCSLQIDPSPVRREEDVDGWGNRILRVCFQGHTDQLEICAHLEVETLETASRLQPGDVRLPVCYGSGLPALAPYLEPPEDGATLAAFVQPLLASAAGDGLAFLAALNQAIHGFYHRGVRLEGSARTPVQTLVRGEGVCRDLAVLFMAACRHAGFAARFVSGYQQGDGSRELRYLHAWPEVYLPGSGWRGYDPTHAAVVGSDHVAVAAAPAAGAVAPVEGGYSFRGAVVTSTLETDIRITTL